MEIPTLTAEPRKAAGSRAAARLRRAGKLPAVIYGHNQPAVPIALDSHAVNHHIQHGLHVIKLEVNGEIQPCQFRDAQYDYLDANLMHIDLIRVDLSERVQLTVPLAFRGTPVGVRAGGIFRHEFTDLAIECIVSDMPDSIQVDISEMELNQALHVKDIVLPEGMTAMLDPAIVVASVRPPSAEAESAEAVEEGEAAKAAEPEVIAKGKGEAAAEKETG